ncbi:MAG: hypothetical protein HFE86_01540 [Clostridiales bacterium]|nr:hypothetical protein [Clostridiales bacterium]
MENTAQTDRLLLARLEDAARLCRLKSTPRFIGFLDERQGVIALAAARRTGESCRLYGGYPDAERTLLGLLPDWCDPAAGEAEALFPIAPVTVVWRADRSVRPLSHRDFLGTLMSLGVKREAVGDIRVGEGEAVFFLLRDILPYVLTQLQKVGGTGVTAKEGLPARLPGADSFLELTDTVASPRLDAVVASLVKGSRGRAEELLAAGLVSLDGLPCDKPTRTVPEGAVIKIRGTGRFVVDALSQPTKKGRLMLRARKYQ